GTDVGGGRQRRRPSQGHAAVADRARAPRNLCRHPRRGRQAARRADAVAQPVPGRRLDADRIAGDDRRGGPLRPPGGRARQSKLMGKMMTYDTIEQEPLTAATAVDRSIEAATRALMALQRSDGHWVFE